MDARDSAKGRPGLTLIEVLVVVTIIGVLVALLIPAVQSAREASRRLQCVNNLKQIGLGLAGYAGVHGCYPQGRGRGSFHPDLSIHVSILPFLGESALYASYNHMLPSGYRENETVCNSRPGLFVCPDDPESTEGMGNTNYAANAGDGFGAYGWNGVGIGGDTSGPRPVRLAEITDGLSRTAAMSEWLYPAQKLDVPRQQLEFESPETLYRSAKHFERLVGVCERYQPTLDALVSHRGIVWAQGRTGQTLYNHASRINEAGCFSRLSGDNSFFPPGSFHPGGVNVLYCDGHTEFVRQEIDRATWRALGSRNGGEVVNEKM